LAWKVNVVGTENVVRACEESDSHPLLIHASTPCIFSGNEGLYSEESKPNPKNYYGITKAEAERMALAYSNSIVFRSNFVPRAKWPYTGAFVDRFGTYLFSDEIAYVVSQLLTFDIRGVVHIVGKEKLSMFELARITTPDVRPMSVRDIDLPLTIDMSMISKRIDAFSSNHSLDRPSNYLSFKINWISKTKFKN
ncbi:MAG: sugar nucleotide-binding protein, partial [Nitrososphaerota archaeon]|nr:sugar nucleotide-binding protein [Nitrososphaerota archaeon]